MKAGIGFAACLTYSVQVGKRLTSPRRRGGGFLSRFSNPFFNSSGLSFALEICECCCGRLSIVSFEVTGGGT